MALWRLHVDVPDQPGRLGELATTIGAAGADIVSLHVVGEPAADGAVTDELLLHLPDGAPVGGVVRAAEGRGFRCTVAARADAHALADPVTTALALARCVLADPGSAPRAVAALLRAELTGAGGPPVAHRAEVAVGRVRVDVGRAWPFTATEISRAAGLLELAGSAALGRAGSEPAGRVQLPGGAEVVLRAATAADAPLVAALHARCTPRTRALRGLSSAPGLTPAVLADLVSADAVLAVTPDGGSAVGLVTLRPDGPDAAAVALLVEDAWQGRGVGTALVRRAVDLARAQGRSEVTAVAPAGSTRLGALLRRTGLRPRARVVDGALHVRAELAPAREPVLAR